MTGFYYTRLFLTFVPCDYQMTLQCKKYKYKFCFPKYHKVKSTSSCKAWRIGFRNAKGIDSWKLDENQAQIVVQISTEKYPRSILVLHKSTQTDAEKWSYFFTAIALLAEISAQKVQCCDIFGTYNKLSKPISTELFQLMVLGHGKTSLVFHTFWTILSISTLNEGSLLVFLCLLTLQTKKNLILSMWLLQLKYYNCLWTQTSW